MKPAKTALLFSLGTISANAWSNTAISSLQEHSLTVLGALATVILVLFIKLLIQSKKVNTLNEKISSLTTSNENLEKIIAEQAETIQQAKKSEANNRITQISNTSANNASPNKDKRSEFDEALIDINVGIKKVRGKEDRYQSLLQEFINRTPNLVTQLTEFVGKSNMQQAKEFASAMKDETGDLALDSLHFCLEDLKNALIDDDLAAIHQKLVDLGRAWRITEREVQKYLLLKSA